MVINCAYDELWDIEKIIPCPKNPNTHPEKQIKLLAKIIKAQGWRVPITVSKRSGFIVRGHARLEAAKILNIDKIPVDLQDYGTEAEEYADLIADNRMAELAVIDRPLLKDILQEIDTGAIDIEITGFGVEEIKDLMVEYHPLEDENEENKDESIAKCDKVSCPECSNIFNIKGNEYKG